jgi:lipopolysaccharide/colanic/teichoic acid biosynthesis glycosyltransferase
MALSQLMVRKKTSTAPWYEAYDPNRRLIRGKTYFRLKRAMDLFLCGLALPFLLIIFAIIALLIKIESPGGPVFYRQQRTSQGGRRFGMFKFRTMVPNAEAMLKDLMHLNELQWPDFKIKNDPRITRVGKILRKTSLDELPQLLNVILGDMSLVGPRPTIFGKDLYISWHTERLDVPQGVTGLWQIEGRASTELDERLRLDIAYIERQSIWFDIVILLRTVFVVIQGRGAY